MPSGDVGRRYNALRYAKRWLEDAPRRDLDHQRTQPGGDPLVHSLKIAFACAEVHMCVDAFVRFASSGGAVPEPGEHDQAVLAAEELASALPMPGHRVVGSVPHLHAVAVALAQLSQAVSKRWKDDPDAAQHVRDAAQASATAQRCLEFHAGVADVSET